MNEPPRTSSARGQWGLISASVVLPVVVVVADLVRGRGLFDEGPPVLDAAHALRSLMLMAAVAALLLGIERMRTRADDEAWPARARWAVWLMLCFVVASTALAATDPLRYHLLGDEDGTLENITALLFAVAAVGAVGGLARRADLSRLARTAGWSLTAGLVMAAGEEISWGQRILGFATPAALAEANLQNEANLHNIATDAFEALFYAGCAFVFLLLPFAVARAGVPRRLAPFAPLVPAPWIAVIAAPAAAMNLDMWDVVPIQLTVWTSIGVLLLLARERRAADDRSLRLVALALAMTMTTQLVALATRATAIELHDVTEYKEFALGLVVAAYGLDLLWSRRAAAGAVT